jgi:hypothetical protein
LGDLALQVTLIIQYSAPGNGPQYRSAYKFWVPRDVLQPSEYRYVGANHDGSAEADSELNGEDDLFKQFSKREGTIHIVLPAETTPGVPNVMQLTGENRQVFFDPSRGFAAFEILKASGQMVRLRKPIKPNQKGTHILSVSWTSKGGMLDVDGDSSEDYDP